MTVIENQTTVACTPQELSDYCVDGGTLLRARFDVRPGGGPRRLR